MSNIGIRNLKFNTSSIIRNVSKKKDELYCHLLRTPGRLAESN